MELNNGQYIGLNVSVYFRDHQVEGTILKLNCMVQYVSDWRFLQILDSIKWTVYFLNGTAWYIIHRT